MVLPVLAWSSTNKMRNTRPVDGFVELSGMILIGTKCVDFTNPKSRG
jgi:hypothetical protein